MNHYLKICALLVLMAASVSLSLGAASAQETPTPPAWDQATLDAAINALFTQTAAAPPVTQTSLPPASPTPTPTATLAATETAPVEAPARERWVNADNLDQIEPLAHFDFESDLVFFHPIVLHSTNRWTAVNTLDERFNGDIELTVWLIDRWALDQPARPIVIDQEVAPDSYPTIHIIDEVMYYLDDRTIILRYNIETGEPLSALQAENEIESFQPSLTENRVVGFMENDEIITWDTTTSEIIHRVPTPRGMVYGFLMPDGRALTTHRNEDLHAIDTETGEVIKTWEEIIAAYPFAIHDDRVFYLHTREGEILKIATDTLRTEDRLNMGLGTEALFVGPVGRFMIAWSDDSRIIIRSFESDLRGTRFSELEGWRYEVNHAEDLFLLNDDDEHYAIYAMTEDGLEELALPEALEDSDGIEDALFFVMGDQLIDVHYSSNFTKARVTFWGIPE